jgi:spore coat polysaccharide biosynthesis protein SpsF (cytidylyltransferase family)
MVLNSPKPKRPVIAIIQARMGSERLPGKILLDVEGQTMLERVVRRVQSAKTIDKVVVATTTDKLDDQTASLAGSLGVHVTRGSVEDVLDRFRQTADETGAQTIVRVSADSPFVDPAVTDTIVDALLSSDADYASNKLHPSYPLGLDVEAFTRPALEKVWKEADKPFERSHVTYRIYSGPSGFKLLPVTTTPNRHDWRWTVDTDEDLRFAREIFFRLEGSNDFSWLDVVALIEKEPELAKINAHLKPKDVTAG